MLKSTQDEYLKAFIKRLPAPLIEPLQQYYARFLGCTGQATHALNQDPKFLEQLWHLMSISDYVGETICRYPHLPFEIFPTLIQSTLTDAQLLADWQHWASQVQDEESIMRCLREFRHATLVKITWREQFQYCDFKTHLQELSALGRVCVKIAVDYIEQQMQQEFGLPMNEQGEVQRFIVIALGKLGANELNLSSDIDLIFAFSEEGSTQHARKMSNSQYFTRLGQQLIKILSQPTIDGFVFRVDMRLRPYGQSGALVISFDALENYYQYQGRDWERYALIKANVIIGCDADILEIQKRLQPFIYRKYLDYGAFQSLREMKEAILMEVKRKQIKNNIKLGPGGIRQVEFLAQAFQLIRGGQNPQLQHQSLLVIVDRLSTVKVIPEAVITGLREAYLFLRKLEHQIQLLHDEQTHTLPDNPLDETRLYYGMHYANWRALNKDLQHHTKRVAKYFEQLIDTPPQFDLRVQNKVTLANQVWPLPAKEIAVEVLRTLGFSDPELVYNQLDQFQHIKAYQQMKKKGLERFDKLMPLLLIKIAAHAHPHLLARMLRLLQSILKRSAYLVLLSERPLALDHLIKIGLQSTWVLDLICAHPILIDELLSPSALVDSGINDLRQELDSRLAWLAPDDLDARMEQLRQFKLAAWCHLAIASFMNTQNEHYAGLINDIAQVILEKSYALSLDYIHKRFHMTIDVEQLKETLPFGIVAYGNLGARTLNFSSDLDLVFLYHADAFDFSAAGLSGVKPEEFYLRLSQRMIHILSTHTPSGLLYDVDVRLRPGGSAGLLVSEFKAFSNYMTAQAWTYEHQALIKARMVLGPSHLANQFNQLRSNILNQARDFAQLKQSILAMHDKVLEFRRTQEALKTTPGGLLDIEFIVEFKVLSHAHQFKQLLESHSTVALTMMLLQLKLITKQQATALTEAYQFFQIQLRKKLLESEDYRLPKEYPKYQDKIKKIWQDIMLT